MKCTKCGNEIPSESKFCLSCGQSIQARSEAPAPVAAPKKSVGVWAVLAGLVIVIIALALLFIRGSRVTQAPTVPNPQQAPVLHAPATPSGPQPNVLNTDVEKPPLQPKAPPPAEVVAYLEHLKRVDEARVALQEREKTMLYGYLFTMSADKAKAFKGIMDALEQTEGPLPKDLGKLPQASKLAPELNKEWQSLAQLFLSMPAPDQCATLAGKYYSAIGGVVQWCVKLNHAMDNQDETIFKLIGQTGNIDDDFDSADKELSMVCNKYGIDKTFAIKSDRTGGTGLFTLPGM